MHVHTDTLGCSSTGRICLVCIERSEQRLAAERKLAIDGLVRSVHTSAYRAAQDH